MVVFAGFYAAIVPAMMLSDLFQIDVVFKAVSYLLKIQSLFTLSLFNFLIHGRRYPAVITVLFWIGIPAHAFVGWMIGKFLQKHVPKSWQKASLFGSLVVFEIVVTMIMVYAMRTDLWLNVWRLPGDSG
ncbi:MAG: hypothetical protein KAG66_00265 [Methylococcales bacterium]|nr:hypothetical protein [Methylococcales bacterium]